MTRSAFFNRVVPSIASVAVGVVPIAVLIGFWGVPRKLILGWGILSYIIGVTVLKLPVYHLFVVPVLHSRLSPFWLSCTQGVISALCELGSAALFFLFVVPELTLPQLVGFGVAAGSVEAVVLPFIGNPFSATPLEKHAEETLVRTLDRPAFAWLGVLERILASATHVATRGLIYVAVTIPEFIPGFIAVATFAALDGRGYYAHLSRWRFDDTGVLLRFYRSFAVIASIQIIAFLIYAGRI